MATTAFLRTYETRGVLAVYLDSAAPGEHDRHRIPQDVFRRARYVEAVCRDGTAFVLKNAAGPTGRIASTTEPRAVRS